MDIQDSQRIKEIRDNTAKIADALERLADGKEQVMTLKEYKQSIIEYMDFGIIHTDLQDAYSIGFRNGIKWCKSLIDGVEPIYDSITDTPQTDKDKVVCPNCGRSDYIRSFEKDFGIKNSEYRYKCINCNTYIKDTPQTEQTDCGWK